MSVDRTQSLPAVGVVILTQGRRPADLRRAIASVVEQREVDVNVAIVGNGWDPRQLAGGLPKSVTAVALDENLGIPAGRNAGVSHVTGEFLFFLDDDASLASDGFLRAAISILDAAPDIGMLQPQVVDPTGLVSPRRWIPRIRKGSASSPSNVFSVWEGAVLLRRSVFDATGGWAAPFFYAHEGIELAWRVWDAGYRAWYAGDLVANHPVIVQTRHSYYFRLTARNRVWLAKRNLPAAIGALYVGAWTGVQLLRWIRNPPQRGTGEIRAWFGGWREGWADSAGPRRPLKWSTIWRMTRAGRPPII